MANIENDLIEFILHVPYIIIKIRENKAGKWVSKIYADVKTQGKLNFVEHVSLRKRRKR